ncbi:MAG: A24 family peptidase, partial [Nanoarchaeota archaeon]
MYEEIIVISTALIGLIIATFTDLKFREVPDYLSYILIASGFGFRFFYSALSNNWYYFLYGFLGFMAAFLVGLILYLTKQWGGGDTKLLMGLGVIFATRPYFVNDDSLFLLNLFLNIFLAGALYGIGYGIYLALKHKNSFTKEFKRILKEDKIKFIRNLILVISFILFVLIFLANDYATKLILAAYIIFLVFYVHLW